VIVPFFRPLLPLIACLVILLLPGCAQERQRGPVVLGAASLQEALEEVADAWAADGHARPVLSFAGTSSLARQAEGGAPADIFFSADAEWMDWLDERMLIRTGTRRDVLSNSLAFIAADGTDATMSLARFAGRPGDERLAMADPAAIPAGRYARAALVKMEFWDALQDHIVPTENVRAALALVERGEARYGIVYASDALASNKVVELEQIPETATPDIRYPAALLAASQHKDATAFLAYLSGDEAAAIFRAHGFEPLAGCASC